MPCHALLTRACSAEGSWLLASWGPRLGFRDRSRLVKDGTTGGRGPRARHPSTKGARACRLAAALLLLLLLLLLLPGDANEHGDDDDDDDDDDGDDDDSPSVKSGSGCPPMRRQSITTSSCPRPCSLKFKYVSDGPTNVNEPWDKMGMGLAWHGIRWDGMG